MTRPCSAHLARQCEKLEGRCRRRNATRSALRKTGAPECKCDDAADVAPRDASATSRSEVACARARSPSTVSPKPESGKKRHASCAMRKPRGGPSDPIRCLSRAGLLKSLGIATAAPPVNSREAQLKHRSVLCRMGVGVCARARGPQRATAGTTGESRLAAASATAVAQPSQEDAPPSAPAGGPRCMHAVANGDGAQAPSANAAGSTVPRARSRRSRASVARGAVRRRPAPP